MLVKYHRRLQISEYSHFAAGTKGSLPTRQSTLRVALDFNGTIGTIADCVSIDWLGCGVYDTAGYVRQCESEVIHMIRQPSLDDVPDALYARNR